MPNPTNTFFLDSYIRGRMTLLQTSDFATLGHVLEAENISMENVRIRFVKNGQSLDAFTAATTISEGDTITITNAANKSG
mgnify:FL=1